MKYILSSKKDLFISNCILYESPPAFIFSSQENLIEVEAQS